MQLVARGCDYGITISTTSFQASHSAGCKIVGQGGKQGMLRGWKETTIRDTIHCSPPIRRWKGWVFKIVNSVEATKRQRPSASKVGPSSLHISDEQKSECWCRKTTGAGGCPSILRGQRFENIGCQHVAIKPTIHIIAWHHSVFFRIFTIGTFEWNFRFVTGKPLQFGLINVEMPCKLFSSLSPFP